MSTTIKSIGFASLGMIFEWYDFALYALLSNYLVDIFFHNISKASADLLVMAIYAIAFFGRFIGGAILASFADCYGRKKAYVLSSLLMTGSSLLMAIFPVYYLQGDMAIFALFLLRFLQGVSVGAETPGGTVFAYEHANKKYKGFALGLLYSCSALGFLAALIVCTMLTSYFSKQAIVQYAWRLPYMMAVVFGLLVFWMRTMADETPDFKRIGISTARKPLSLILSKYKYFLLICTGLYFLTTCLSEFAGTSNIYVTRYFHYHIHSVYLLASLQISLGIVVILLFSLVLTRINIKIFVLFIWLLVVLFVCPSFWLLATHTNFAYFIWYFLLDKTDALFFLCVILFVANAVPTKIRTSMVTLFVNISQLIGSLFPFFVTYLMNKTADPYIAPKIIWLLSLVMLVAIIRFVRMRKRQSKSNIILGSSQFIS